MIIEFFKLIDSYCCEWIKWQWIFIEGSDWGEEYRAKRALSAFQMNLIKNEYATRCCRYHSAVVVFESAEI